MILNSFIIKKQLNEAADQKILLTASAWDIGPSKKLNVLTVF